MRGALRRTPFRPRSSFSRGRDTSEDVNERKKPFSLCRTSGTITDSDSRRTNSARGNSNHVRAV
ncbi:hypothetical protein PUN28_014331 [Cardiocondyla obscurior]|uniref:Uncharacterized protein n=1 Tax=Cardiocondyla obscurior TaxID=286306 RepID=A0AAW2F386_9HYME